MSPTRRAAPAGDSRPERNNDHALVGEPSTRPSGSSRSRPRDQTKVRRSSALEFTRRSLMPSRSTSASPAGLVDRNESAPASTTSPSTRCVAILPPNRSAASTTVTGTPASASSSAAVRPAIPPPTTTTGPAVTGYESLAEVLVDQRDQRVGQSVGVVEHGHAFQPEAEFLGPGPELDVDVVERLDVVGQESDRRDHHTRHTVVGQCVEGRLHFRAEPWLRGTALALVGECGRLPRRQLRDDRVDGGPHLVG